MHRNEGNAHLRYVRQFRTITFHSDVALIITTYQMMRPTICSKVSILLVTTCTHTLCTRSTPHSLQPRKHCNLGSKKSTSFKIFLTLSLY